MLLGNLFRNSVDVSNSRSHIDLVVRQSGLQLADCALGNPFVLATGAWLRLAIKYMD